MYALALSDSSSSKKPMTTTSSFSVKALASSRVSSLSAGGPVRFISHATISFAVLPPVEIISHDWEGRERFGID